MYAIGAKMATAYANMFMADIEAHIQKHHKASDKDISLALLTTFFHC